MRAIPMSLCGLLLAGCLSVAAAQDAPPASLTPDVLPDVPEAVVAAPVEADGVPALSHDDVEAWLDGFLPYALARGDIAGAVVVVVKDGQVLLQKGYGYADIAERAPVDPDATLFRPGSISKLFTWTAVMQLVEQGKLDLDADLSQYVDFELVHDDGEPMTLRQVM